MVTISMIPHVYTKCTVSVSYIFCCSHYTAARYRLYLSSTVCSTVVVNKYSDQLRSIVVIGSSQSMVVYGNILSVSATVLSTPDMLCMLGPNYLVVSSQCITLCYSL